MNCEICNKKVSGNYLDSYCDDCIEKFDLLENDYDDPEFKDMIMTYSDKTLSEHK